MRLLSRPPGTGGPVRRILCHPRAYKYFPLYRSYFSANLCYASRGIVAGIEKWGPGHAVRWGSPQTSAQEIRTLRKGRRAAQGTRRAEGEAVRLASALGSLRVPLSGFLQDNDKADLCSGCHGEMGTNGSRRPSWVACSLGQCDMWPPGRRK